MSAMAATDGKRGKGSGDHRAPRLILRTILRASAALPIGWLPLPGLAADAQVPQVAASEVKRLIARSFSSSGQVTVDSVLRQDATQSECSAYTSHADVPAHVARRIQSAEAATIRYPRDGKWLGDWKEGEKIAQSGRGLQFSDPRGGPNGANCYACHQLSPQEISFGNLGPSLYQYGKLRGDAESVLRYTWARLWNAHAFTACSSMPRFGHNGILTEQQIRDVMALLFDPASPVNR